MPAAAVRLSGVARVGMTVDRWCGRRWCGWWAVRVAVVRVAEAEVGLVRLREAADREKERW